MDLEGELQSVLNRETPVKVLEAVMGVNAVKRKAGLDDWGATFYELQKVIRSAKTLKKELDRLEKLGLVLREERRVGDLVKKPYFMSTTGMLVILHKYMKDVLESMWSAEEVDPVAVLDLYTLNEILTTIATEAAVEKPHFRVLARSFAAMSIDARVLTRRAADPEKLSPRDIDAIISSMAHGAELVLQFNIGFMRRELEKEVVKRIFAVADRLAERTKKHCEKVERIPQTLRYMLSTYYFTFRKEKDVRTSTPRRALREPWGTRGRHGSTGLHT